MVCCVNVWGVELSLNVKTYVVPVGLLLKLLSVIGSVTGAQDEAFAGKETPGEAGVDPTKTV